jgi:hypothetical protein
MSDRPQLGKRKHLSLALETQDAIRIAQREITRLEQLIHTLPETAPTTTTEWEAAAYALLRQRTAVSREMRAAELLLEETIELIRYAPEPEPPIE